MNNIELLALIAEWQEEILSTEGITREWKNEIYSEIGSKPIKIITGFRRAGKSLSHPI